MNDIIKLGETTFKRNIPAEVTGLKKQNSVLIKVLIVSGIVVITLIVININYRSQISKIKINGNIYESE